MGTDAASFGAGQMPHRPLFRGSKFSRGAMPPLDYYYMTPMRRFSHMLIARWRDTRLHYAGHARKSGGDANGAGSTDFLA